MTTASGKPPEPVAEQALRRSQIKPLPKRRDPAGSSVAQHEEPRPHVTIGEWFDAISMGKLPDGMTDKQAELVRQYHARLHKD